MRIIVKPKLDTEACADLVGFDNVSFLVTWIEGLYSWDLMRDEHKPYQFVQRQPINFDPVSPTENSRFELTSTVKITKTTTRMSLLPSFNPE